MNRQKIEYAQSAYLRVYLLSILLQKLCPLKNQVNLVKSVQTLWQNSVF